MDNYKAVDKAVANYYSLTQRPLKILTSDWFLEMEAEHKKRMRQLAISYWSTMIPLCVLFGVGVFLLAL